MRDLGGDTRVTFLSSRLTLPYRRWGQGGVYMALQVRGDMWLWNNRRGSPTETHLEWGL